jgi:hypothetical protein
VCNELSLRHSNYSLKKYLRDCKPAELTLVNRTKVRKTVTYDEVISSIVYVPETMQYISILGTVQKLLEDMENLRLLETSRNSNVSESLDVIRLFSDAEYFQQHELSKVDKDLLQLHVFFDEFETTNPLGPKANIHKLGGLHMSVKNIPAAYISQLHSIFPVVYCYSSDVKKYGYEAMLQPLLNDLKVLENGVQLLICGKLQTVYGAAVMWSGDNLGIHQIFGFSPNFNSNKCCQLCYADRTVVRTAFVTVRYC